MAMLWKYTEL